MGYGDFKLDLNRLIGIKKYRVGLSLSEVFEEIEKFLCQEELLPGYRQWDVTSVGTRYRAFERSLMWTFIASKMKVHPTRKEIKQLEKEFDEDVPGHSDEILDGYRHELPYEMYVLILDVDDLGCVCQAECRSALYEKLCKQHITLDAVSDFQISRSYLESLSFLDKVFIGVLGAKPILDIPVKSPDIELLMNDTQQREITELIDSLLDKATGEVLICGWIGTHFIPKLRELENEGIKIRFITHQPSEAKNQPWRSEINQAFKKLCSHIGKENICTDPNMHGRIIIIDNKALIGSMDLNAYSLTGAHTEFAIYTEQPKIVRRLRNVFNSKFKPLKTS